MIGCPGAWSPKGLLDFFALGEVMPEEVVEGGWIFRRFGCLGFAMCGVTFSGDIILQELLRVNETPVSFSDPGAGLEVVWGKKSCFLDSKLKDMLIQSHTYRPDKSR